MTIQSNIETEKQNLITLIRQTESNIENWYTKPNEDVRISMIEKESEIAFLGILMNRLKAIGGTIEARKSRIERLKDTVECF